MSRNGSGIYTLPDNGWNPAVDGNSATPEDWQELIDDVASALTQSLSSDGQTEMTGDLDMGQNNVSDMAQASATGQALEFRQLFSQGTEVAVASAATVDIGAQNTNFLRITGTTTITSLGTNFNGPKFVRFTGALTLTHNGSALSLPGGANITTANNDRAIFVPRTGGWNCVSYQYASGTVINGNVFINDGASNRIKLANSGDASVVADVLFYSAGAIASQANMYVNIDADNSSTDARFIVGKDVQTSAATRLFEVCETGDVLIGTSGIGTGLLRINSANGVAAELTNTGSDVTNKVGRICVSRYTNSQTPMHLVGGNSTLADNNVQIGGGSTAGAPATNIQFYTGALSAVGASGTLRGSIDSSGNLFMTGVYASTTASAANVFVETDGQLKRSTSSIEFKEQVEDMDMALAKRLVALFRAVWYRSKCEGDNKEWSWYGAIAEEVAEIDPRYVHWGYRNEDYEDIVTDGASRRTLKEGAKLVPVGLMYERFTIPLMMVAQDYEARLQALEAKVL